MPFTPHETNNKQGMATSTQSPEMGGGFKPFDEQKKSGFSPSTVAGGLGLTLGERNIPFVSSGARAFEGLKENLGGELNRIGLEEQAKISDPENITQGELESAGISGGAKFALPLAGGIVGAAGETLLGGAIDTVKAFIPDAQEDKIEQGFQAILETEGGQTALEFLGKGMDAWEGFAEENPNIAANVEGALKLAEIVPGVKAVKTGINLTRKGLRVGEELAEGAVRIKGLLNAGEEVAEEVIEQTVKVSPKSKRTALEILRHTGKKSEQVALAEGRVITPKTKLEKILFGEKITPSQFEEQAATFMSERIPNLSNNRAKAIGQVTDTVDSINKEVTQKALKFKAAPKSLDGLSDGFLSKADDIATDLSKSVDDRAIKKYIDQFNNNITELRTKLDSKGGSLEDIRVSRKKWDNSFDKSIRSITPDQIVGKPNSTQLKWKMWMEGRGELNNKFFDIAAEQGDDLMRKNLKDMSLGIRSIDDIAKNGGVAKDLWRQHKAKIITSGLTALGLSAIN